MAGKVAFLFPGQGSQSIGMGKEIIELYPETREIYDNVDKICSKSISQLCFEGPMDELTLTVNLQPAITAASLVCLSALQKEGIRPLVSAGHSLGEYASLVSINAVSAFDAIRLVQKRGELMHRESLIYPGAMAALLGKDIDVVSEIVKEIKSNGILAVANHNTAEQIVITGENEPVKLAMSLAKEKGAKAIPLKVSGAWHCDLMKGAVDEFRGFMEEISFSVPESGMLFNATADEETEPGKIKDIMAQQLISPVKWYDIILKMLEQDIDTFIEIGPKKVLTGLVKKIIPQGKEVMFFNIEDKKSLDVCLNSLG